MSSLVEKQKKRRKHQDEREESQFGSRVDPVDNDDDKDESPLVINFSEVLDEDPSFGSDINNKMLDAIKGIEKIEDAIDFVTNFSSMSNLKLDYQSTINDFIYSIVKTFAGYFVLNENYFKEILPEYHLGATIHVQIFMNLFRDKNYIV
ncbi:381_t:CDS:2 [Entrophospora sp. SA101]|nr:381_t:CDS:2 [Entrophospora sp. SA101]